MKRIKEKIEILNLNYKKEIIRLLITDLFIIALCIALFFLNINYLVLALTLIGGVVFNVYYFNRYDELIKRREKKLDDEFIEVFSYLRIYIYNQENVYTALLNIREFSNELMVERINVLLSEIDNDKSLQPFINFARKFQNKVIEEVMISLYEIINNGNNEVYLNQFIKVFEEFKENKKEDDTIKRNKIFDNINMLSLIGSGIIMIILSFAVVEILGEVASGF